MPRHKDQPAKKPCSRSTILNYFSATISADKLNDASSSFNQILSSNTTNKSKIKLKRKTKDVLINKNPKVPCNPVNIEPIVISSSDEDFVDSSIPDTRKPWSSTKENKTLFPPCNAGFAQNCITNEKIPKQLVKELHFIEKKEKKPATTSSSNQQSSFVVFNETETLEPLQDDSEQESGDGKIAYYHLNFCHVINTVLNYDDDRALFEGSEDMNWIIKFRDLPLSAQKLYVRLYHRKVAWLRKEQIHYPNITKNIHKVLEQLASTGFLLSFQGNSSADLDLNQVLELLLAPSLKEIAKSFKISVNGSQKSQIRDDICKMCRQQRSLIGGFFSKKSNSGNFGLEANVMRRACKVLGPCYKVATPPRKAFNRVLLVFDVTRGIDDELDCTLTGSRNAFGQGQHLQLSAILMAGMGKVSYPQFQVNRTTSIFKRRVDLLQYETAFQFQMDALACVEAGKWAEASSVCDNANSIRHDMTNNDPESLKYAENLPEFLRSFTAPWVYTRLRSLEVEILQRLKNYQKAVEILKELLEQRSYCLSRRGHWWERLALNVDQHLKDPVGSMNIIHDSLNDSDVRVGHKLALAERANKILASKAIKKLPQLSNIYKDKLKQVIDGLEIKHAPVVEISGCLLPVELQSGKSRFVRGETEDCEEKSSSTVLCSVEELALSHYKSIGYPCGIHGEGGTFSTLFCLFLWDIIFMDGIPDVFRTSYQAHPLDYHTDGFYLSRRQMIDIRLREIANIIEADFGTDSSSVLDVFTATWDMEQGKACSGMDWERFSSLDEALGLVECIGGKVLSGIFKRLCKDLRHTRSGLPDLVVWNPTKKTYKLVEVKGPGDRLSTNQKLWIDELVTLGANIEVCRVVAIGGKRIAHDK